MRVRIVDADVVEPFQGRTGILYKIEWIWEEPARQRGYEDFPDVIVILDDTGEEVRFNVDLLVELTPLEQLAMEA